MKPEDATEVLRSLLHETRAAPAGVKESCLRAKHDGQQDLIDTLIFRQGKILRQDGCVHLHPAAIAELAPVDPVAANLHAASSRVFLAVRERTKAGADENLPVETLANDLEMLPGDLIELLKPMTDTGIFATYDLNSDKGYVLPSVVTVLRHKTYGELVDRQRALATSDADSPALMLMKHRTVPRSAQSSYVDEQRLDALRSITSSEWDFTRLIRLCEELNTAHEGDAWMTCAMLVRGIVDHVPPIFSCANFSAVANNYAGSKSFQDHMRHLDNSLRKVADAHLHVQIRASESLPTFVQVDFRSDLDALLGEVVRLLKARPA